MRLRRNCLVLGTAVALLTAGLQTTAAVAVSAGPNPVAPGRSSANSAAKVLPSTAKLRNPAGHTDGCTVSVALPFLQVPQQGEMTIELRNRGNCPKSANIHWMAMSTAAYQVLPDGSRAVLYPRGLSWTGSSPTDGPPLSGSTGIAGEYLICADYGLSGPVTLIFNAKLRAWSREHDEAQVFHAVVEREQTVDCT